MDTPPQIEEPFEEETIVERIIGLGEMFPEPLRNLTSASVSKTFSCASWIFDKSRTVTWFLCSTAAILVLPISLETERADYEQQLKQQEKNILLGPDTQIM